MRRLVFIVLLVTAAAYPQESGAPKQSPPKARKLGRAEVEGLLAHPGRVLFIDVRRPDEISAIGGFPVYLSIQVGELEKHLSEIPNDRLLVTVSNHATRAARAAELLEAKGFKVAGTVGIEDYVSDGGRIVKIEAPKQSAPPNR